MYYEINNFYMTVFHFLKAVTIMQRLLTLAIAPKLKYILYLDVWEAMCTKFTCMISIMQSHVSLTSVAKTLHTTSSTRKGSTL